MYVLLFELDNFNSITTKKVFKNIALVILSYFMAVEILTLKYVKFKAQILICEFLQNILSQYWNTSKVGNNIVLLSVF